MRWHDPEARTGQRGLSELDETQWKAAVMVKELVDAGAFLVEMAGYAIGHLEEEWARRGGAGNDNRGELRQAAADMAAVLDRWQRFQSYEDEEE